MMCYKDRTFCINRTCMDVSCYNYYYESLEDDAKEFGLPISMADLSKDCEDYTTTTTEDPKEEE